MRTKSPSAGPSLPASPDEIDIRAIGAAVRRHAGKLALAALAAGLMAFAATLTMTPKFASQAQIEVISKGVGNPFETRREGGPQLENVAVRMDKEAIGTHVRGMLSTDLALKVAADLELAKNPEFNRAVAAPGLTRRLFGSLLTNARETDEDRVLKSYFEAVKIYQLKDTRGIMIDFLSTDPKLSAQAANRIAERYRDTLSERSVLESSDARAKLGPQIMKLAQEVADAEAAVTRFRGQSNIFDGGRDRTGLNEQQLAELTADLTRAASSRADAEARAREARSIAQRGGGETLADVQKSQLVPRLVEQRVRVERQISELSATLLPAHPRMKQLHADLDGLNLQIDGEVDKIVQGLEREAKVAQLREDGVRTRIDEAKRRVVEAGGDDVKLRALESVAKSKRAEFERLQGQLESARTTSDALAVPVEIQIISRARPAIDKASPKTGMMVAMAAVATFLLGLACVVLHALFTGARSQGTERSDTRTPPSTPQPASAATAWLAANRRQPQLGSTAEIARYLVDKAERRSGFRTVVAPQSIEGAVGDFPLDLARQISLLKRQVILMDWSLDGVGVSRELGVVPRAGVGEVLAGKASFEDVIVPLPGSAAHVIAAGTGLIEPAGSIDRDRVNMLLDALDEVYDHIIITGGYAPLRELFTTIEGCIDAGVVLTTPQASVAASDFLGFHVADLDVIRCAYDPGEEGNAINLGGVKPGLMLAGPPRGASA